MSAPVIATPVYPDARAAVDFLIEAFGFQMHASYEDADGTLAHVELTLGASMVMPASVGRSEYGQLIAEVPSDGKPTGGFYVVVADVDDHHARARSAGAEILTGPRTRTHGGSEYTCRDVGGHVWTFGSYDPWAAKAD